MGGQQGGRLCTKAVICQSRHGSTIHFQGNAHTLLTIGVTVTDTITTFAQFQDIDKAPQPNVLSTLVYSSCSRPLNHLRHVPTRAYTCLSRIVLYTTVLSGTTTAHPSTNGSTSLSSHTASFASSLPPLLFPPLLSLRSSPTHQSLHDGRLAHPRLPD